jgi:hypothetical protein
LRADLVQQGLKHGAIELRAEKPGNVFVGAADLVARVHEAIQLTELEFYSAAHLPRLQDRAVLSDDVQSVLDIALVIVGQVEDEKILEVKARFHMDNPCS